MTHPNFAAQAQAVTERLADIQNTAVQEQMLVPIALSKILPVGVLGLFTAVMLAGTIGADQTYLHSWGSIFIQDVILPFRKKAFTPKQHISLLRISIGFVAIFIFIFSIFFRQNDYILMYINLTGAIYLGGAGAVIIGGLYWKRGSVLGAWLAMIVGIILAFGGLVIRQIWPFTVPHLISFFGNIDWLVNNRTEFPYNGMQINVFAICCAIAAYIFGSLWNWLIQGRKEFNMARMLHRGEYADENEKEEIKLPPTGIKAILPTPEFTGWDKFLYWALIVWTLGWFAFFLIVTACHFIWGTTYKWWLAFWHFKMELTIFLGLITTVWFLWGGMRDFFDLFRSLKSAIQKTDDDGCVPPAENSK